MASATAVSRESAFPSIRLPRIHCNPLLSSLVFFASDTVAIAVTGALVLLGAGKWRYCDIHRYVALWPALGYFSAYLLTPTFTPASSITRVAELRRLAFGLTSCFLVVAGMILVTRSVGLSPTLFFSYGGWRQ